MIQSCLLLGNTLTSPQLSACIRISLRSYDVFYTKPPTGANTLDVASIGVDLALLTNNATLITDAYRRVHSEVVIQQAIKADGIRPDGGFAQHLGVLYNGNYGEG